MVLVSTFISKTVCLRCWAQRYILWSLSRYSEGSIIWGAWNIMNGWYSREDETPWERGKRRGAWGWGDRKIDYGERVWRRKYRKIPEGERWKNSREKQRIWYPLEGQERKRWYALQKALPEIPSSPDSKDTCGMRSQERQKSAFFRPAAAASYTRPANRKPTEALL